MGANIFPPAKQLVSPRNSLDSSGRLSRTQEYRSHFRNDDPIPTCVGELPSPLQSALWRVFTRSGHPRGGQCVLHEVLSQLADPTQCKQGEVSSVFRFPIGGSNDLGPVTARLISGTYPEQVLAVSNRSHRDQLNHTGIGSHVSRSVQLTFTFYTLMNTVPDMKHCTDDPGGMIPSTEKTVESGRLDNPAIDAPSR